MERPCDLYFTFSDKVRRYLNCCLSLYQVPPVRREDAIQAVLPAMLHHHEGCIINTSSICGLVGHMNTPEAYTATKGAITLLTKSVAARYGKDNIRCNSIHPATVDTPFVAALMADPVKKQARLKEIPLGRLTSVEDVANAVLYLASDEASFLNGVNLPIDGGVTCY